MKISVKRWDLFWGRRNKPAKCPIARALNRTAGGTWVVHDGYAMRLFERPLRCYPLPKEAIQFVWKFDSGNKVAPFTFEFEA